MKIYTVTLIDALQQKVSVHVDWPGTPELLTENLGYILQSSSCKILSVEEQGDDE